MDEMIYKYGDDEIIISEDSYGKIYVHEENKYMEIEFYHTEVDKVLEVLKNIYNFLQNNMDFAYVNTDYYDYIDECGESTGEWYWEAELMDDEDINPYFSAGDSFRGNCLYREQLPYIIEAIQEYLKPKDLSEIDNLTLKYILRFKKELMK